MNAKTASRGTASIKKRRTPDDSSQEGTEEPIVRKKGKAEGRDPSDILLRFMENANQNVVIEILRDEAGDTLLENEAMRRLIADRISLDETGKLAEFVEKESTRNEKWRNFFESDLQKPQDSLEELLSSGITNGKTLSDDILVVMRKLVGKGAILDDVNKRGGGPLFYKSVLKNPTMLRYMINELGVNPGRCRITKDGGSEPVICEAFRLGAWEALEFLLDRDEPSYLMHSPGQSEPGEAVDWIIDQQKLRATIIVIKSQYLKGRNHGHPRIFFQPENVKTASMLHHAIVENNFRLFRAILKHNPDFVNADIVRHKSSADSGSLIRYTALHVAAYFGSTRYLRMLLDCEIKRLGKMQKVYEPMINMRGPEPHGLTPLYLACLNSKAHNAKFLIENGADPDKSDPNRSSELPDFMSMMGRFGHSACLEQVVKSGGLTKIKMDKEGRWFWHYFMFAQNKHDATGLEPRLKNIAKEFSKWIHFQESPGDVKVLYKESVDLYDKWVMTRPKGEKTENKEGKEKENDNVAEDNSDSDSDDNNVEKAQSEIVSTSPVSSTSVSITKALLAIPLAPKAPTIYYMIHGKENPFLPIQRLKQTTGIDNDTPLPTPFISNSKISPQQSLRSVQNQH